MSYSGTVLLRGGISPASGFPINMPLVDAAHVWVAEKYDAEEDEDLGYKLSDMLINITGTEKLFNGQPGQYLKLDSQGNTLKWGAVSSVITTASELKENPVNSVAVDDAMTIRLTGINAADITAGDNNKILVADTLTKGYKLVSIEDLLLSVYNGELRIVPGGTASGVSLSKYSTQQEALYKQELVDNGEFTAEELSRVTVLNITGNTTGTVNLDVSELGNVGNEIKIMHKKTSTDSWESLYDGKIPNNYIVTVTLTEFSPIVGSKHISKALPKYVTFTAQTANSSVKIEIVGTLSPITLYYSTDNSTWQPYTINTKITLTDVGDYVSFYGVGNQRATYYTSRYLHFVMTGKIAGSGNCNALLDSEVDYTKPYCCYHMFYGCASLTQAPDLPATNLANYCYSGMFQYCDSLTHVSDLPATTLANYCYSYMFEGCTSLTQAPELLNTTSATSCYYDMFRGCIKLTQAPKLPATTLASYCYAGMFSGCSSLKQTPELPAITLASGCYLEMFSGCTSLTQAPELPATTLSNNCYDSMFQGCTSLTQVSELSATELANSCYDKMFSGCTSLTQAPKQLSATTLKAYCYHCMFRDCISLTQAPELPATTLAHYCYHCMFQGCTSLTQAPELPATTLADDCYSGMFYGCASLTQAPELPATYLTDDCYWSMFQGCTSLTQAPELPATMLAYRCYQCMFYGCISLTQAPELPATTLTDSCYFYMFQDCYSLTSVKTAASNWTAVDASNWLCNTASSGKVYCPSDSTIPSNNESGVPYGWSRVDWTPGN